MKTVKIIGSVYAGPEFKARKFNIPTILAKPIKGVLELLGYYAV
jgi:hypothetical protein